MPEPTQPSPDIAAAVLPRAAGVEFGRRLRKLRKQYGLSQVGLARRIDVHPTAIARMERSAREAQLSTILRIAQGIDVQPGTLLNDLIDAEAPPPPTA
jgi:transcriptional regulator with XRE-family HTH domain